MRGTLLWLAVLVACDDRAAAGPPIEDLKRQELVASCASVFRCCSESERPSYTRQNSEATCASAPLAAEETTFAPVVAAVKAGEIDYDPSLAAECLAGLEDQCGWIQRPRARPAACARMLVGKVGDGGACDTSLACTEGLACDGFIEPGKCRPKARLDEPCGRFPCAESLYCPTVLDTQNFCVAGQADGAGCVFDDECTSSSCEQGICGGPAAPPQCDGG